TDSRADVRNRCMARSFPSVVKVQRRVQTVYGKHYAPNMKIIIVNTHQKFMETRAVKDKPRSRKSRSGENEEIVETAQETFPLCQGGPFSEYMRK
ncbi:hypothetical protein SK128_025845, partial [Halocaridina rubra]